MLLIGLLAVLPVRASGAAPPAPSAPAPPAASPNAPAASPVVAGVFTDGAGLKHPWTITTAHTLTWNGTPWVPAGVTFSPTSFVAPESQQKQALAADLRRLDALKAVGVQDLLVTPPPAPLPAGGAPGEGLPIRFADVPAAMVQPLLDALEARGFRYGLDLEGRLSAPGEGYGLGETFLVAQQVSAGAFAAAAPKGVDSALFLAKDRSGATVKMGRITAQNGAFVVNAPDPAVKVYLVPVVSAGAGKGAGSESASVWDSFPEDRDAELFALHSLKFGPGLRFFLDPLATPIASSGRAAYEFPSTRRFQGEFEAWLERHFGGPDALEERWGMAPQSLKSFDVAARLVPDSPGAPAAVWDSGGDRTLALAGGAYFWADFESFRREQLRRDMDLLATSLRHNIADVPVVYRWQGFSPIYAGTEEGLRFDGLAISPADARPSSDREAAYAAAQVGDTAAGGWLVLAGGSGALELNNLANLVSLGVKGFFLTPADNGGDALPPATQTLLQYVRQTAGAPAYADFWPHILWFPWNLQAVSVRRLADGSWWLPTFRAGETVPLGPDLEAYRMTDPPAAANTVVLWSADGPQIVHVKLPAAAAIDWPPGVQRGKPEHGLVALSLGAEPLVVSGVQPSDLFPVEELEKLVSQADDLRKTMLVTADLRQRLLIEAATARKARTDGHAYDAYSLLSADLALERRLVLPYLWVEGEAAASQSFTGIATDRSCSGGAYLYLNTPDDSPLGKPYQASWNLSVTTPGRYDLWMGGIPPGQDWSSPAEWRLDGAPLKVDNFGPAGPSYGALFHWSHLGQLSLSTGKHTLTLTVTGRRIAPDRSYVLAVDAIVFAPTDELSRQFLESSRPRR